MLVQAQVVPWWGTGRPAEFSPSRSTPSRASPTGRRIGGYDYKTESFQRPRAETHARFREIRNSNFFAILRIWFLGLPRPSVVPIPRATRGEQPDENEERKHHDQLDEHDDHRPRPDHESQEPYEK